MAYTKEPTRTSIEPRLTTITIVSVDKFTFFIIPKFRFVVLFTDTNITLLFNRTTIYSNKNSTIEKEYHTY